MLRAPHSLLYLAATWALSCLVTITRHFRTPDQPPLPDTFIDSVPLVQWGFFGTEVAMGLLTLACVIAGFFTCDAVKRSKMFCRFCLILGTVFVLRASAIYLTTLTSPGKHHENCRLIDDQPFGEKLSMFWYMFIGFGLVSNGIHTCGDYFFSGHTSIITLLQLLFCYYTPRNWTVMHCLARVINTCGVYLIMASHEHYSIDILFGFIITYLLFHTYHAAISVESSLFPRKTRLTRLIMWLEA